MWYMGNGESIDFWQDKWIPGMTIATLSDLPGSLIQSAKVAQFVDSSKLAWDVEKLQRCIPEVEVRPI